MNDKLKEAREYLEYTKQQKFSGIRPSNKARMIIGNLITEIEKLLSDAQSRMVNLHHWQEQVEKAEAEIKRLDEKMITIISEAGLCTPQEGYRKAGWHWLQHDINELKNQTKIAEVRIKEACKKAIREKWEQYEKLDTDITPGPELYCVAIDAIEKE